MAEVSFLRPHQVEDIKSEIDEQRRMAGAPSNLQVDRGAASRRVRALENQLETYAPPEINKQQESRLVKMKRDIEKRIQEGMPSHEEMRRAPQGAIDKHRRWERRNKQWIRRLKNINLTLTNGSGDTDAANIEYLRPHESTIGMHSAIIGKDQDAYSFPSEQFQRNYDSVDWSAHRNPTDDFPQREEPRPDRAEMFVSSMDGGLGKLDRELNSQEEDERLAAADREAAEAGAEIPKSLDSE